MGGSAGGLQATPTKHTKSRTRNNRRLDDTSEDDNFPAESEDASLEHCDPSQVQSAINGTRTSSRSKKAPESRMLDDIYYSAIGAKLCVE